MVQRRNSRWIRKLLSISSSRLGPPQGRCYGLVGNLIEEDPGGNISGASSQDFEVNVPHRRAHQLGRAR